MTVRSFRNFLSLVLRICLIILLFVLLLCTMLIDFTNTDFENGRNINKLNGVKRFLRFSRKRQYGSAPKFFQGLGENTSLVQNNLH